MSRSPGGEPRESPLLQLVYYGYRVASALARVLPERLAYGVADRCGTILARRSPKRTVVARNLARVTGRQPGSPEVQDLVVRSFRSYAEYWLETFRLVQAPREFFLERLLADGEDHLLGALANGRGVVVVIGHLGNWDAAGAWAATLTGSLVTVAEVLRPRRMFDFFADHRRRLGMTILPARPGVTSELVELARAGHVIAILGDRDLKGTGVEVDFFGEPATFPVGAAAIARRAEVPLLVAGVRSERRPTGRGWRATIGPPVELPEGTDDASAVAELTRAVARELERHVAATPEQWHVFQPFWLADRAPG
ncbi:MAG: phosphatidylinositol mannoside acyltransferase [Actinomycetota bacterium]